MAQGADPGGAFDDPRYAVGSAAYVNVFRYLAKVLACQIAKVSGPRIAALVDFAINKSDANPVSVRIGPDGRFRFWFEHTGDPEFAGHGGLGATFSKRTGLTNGFTSSLTHGPLRYEFWIGFNWMVGLLLRLQHPAFHERLAKARREALAEGGADAATA